MSDEELQEFVNQYVSYHHARNPLCCKFDRQDILIGIVNRPTGERMKRLRRDAKANTGLKQLLNVIQGYRNDSNAA